MCIRDRLGRVRHGRIQSWKVRSPRDRTNRIFEHQNSGRNSLRIQEILSEIIRNSEIWGFVNILSHFLNYSSKFWESLIENCAKFDENCLKNHDFYINFSKNMKTFDKNLRRFWVSSGAKVWESCRSRKTLQNEYLDAKIGVDTAENEPFKT